MKYALTCVLLLALMPFAVPMMFVMVAVSIIGGLYLIVHELFFHHHSSQVQME